MQVYERLDYFIKQSGYKQKAIASKAKLTENQMSLILNGKMKLTADDLETICQAMGASPMDIYQINTGKPQA